MDSSSIRKPSISSLLHERVNGIKAMLREKYPSLPEDQKHLDEGSAERGYWHYGYLSALQDMLKKMSVEN
jgi:hypothetical protein